MIAKNLSHVNGEANDQPLAEAAEQAVAVEEAPPSARHDVYKACHVHFGFMGWLVMEHDSEVPVAFVPDDGDHQHDPADVAFGIADGQCMEELAFNASVIDLRHTGRPDSPDPLPRWLYGLNCIQVLSDGAEKIKPVGGWVELTFFCRHLKADMESSQQDVPTETEQAEHLRAELEWIENSLNQQSNLDGREQELREAIQSAQQRGLEELGEPTPLKPLQLAKQKWQALPDKQRRRILNGWAPWKKLMTMKELMHAGEIPRPVAIIIAHGKGRFNAVHDTALDSHTDPVSIAIAHGSKQADVMQYLRGALEFVEHHWNKIIENTCR